MSKTFDTAHVRNVGEFFSQHYLDALLEKDLAELFERWSKADKPPERVLASLADRYFRCAAQLAEREPTRSEAVALVRDLHARILEALGYVRAPLVRELSDTSELELTLELQSNRKPFLWVVEAGFGPSFGLAADDSPLDLPPLDDEPSTDASLPLARSWKQLLDGPLFAHEHAPRWLLLLAGGDVFLIDRERWPQGRYLHFELGAMLGHRKPAALRAFVGLLHRDVLAPETVASGGRSLLDEIDERSHKHAFAVSTDLKQGVQKAIEILGNEVIWHRRKQAKQGVFDKPELAAELARECITYMYRLLFLFYVEARGGEVEAVPVKSDAYRMGLSLERLRELELVPLHGDKARNGNYIQQSLDKLFQVIHLGWPTSRQANIQQQLTTGVDLRILPQRSPLFDPKRTPLISAAKLRNIELQKIIRLLSLSKEGARGVGGRQRGRISYAQLGINQLGAVYEGLLSYTGFFANETLHEVKRADDKGKDGSHEHVYYVPASRIGDYHDDELVRDPQGKPVTHPKGSFLFRLAGRDREKSASYYTPEVLTRCLTKYTLKERLGERGKPGALRADEILDLTVCEPAMGSGAFLSEAVAQLAHAYLERKQDELGRTIPAEQYQREWTRVKYHFVAHRVYGVDLNPLAAELAKVSLWLNVLDPELQAPFTNTRLRTGNSLIGARREVYGPAELTLKAKKGESNWFDSPARRLAPGEPRPSDAIYHFLVPNAGMSPYEKDKVVAGLCKQEIERLKKWHKVMALPFTVFELERVRGFSAAIDQLWAEHTQARRLLARRLAQPVVLWGQAERTPDPDKALEINASRHKTVEECEGIVASELRTNGPGARIKAVMDLWCSLWMWPIERAAELPTREQWFDAIDRLLRGGETEDERKANEGRFLHWELEFAEVFTERGGFDVILGNPPWLKLEWEEAGVLGDLEPLLEVRKQSAKTASSIRESMLNDGNAKTAYLKEFSNAVGVQSYLGSTSNFPLLVGAKANLYKCFLSSSWIQVSEQGAVGMLHQPGILDDPSGGSLRSALYRRLRLVAQFRNELKLFSDIGNVRPYVMSVTRGASTDNVDFISFSSLLHPATLDASMSHDDVGPVPNMKNEDGHWDLRPHRRRSVRISVESLKLFVQLYDPSETPHLSARLPVLHSQDMLAVLQKFGGTPTLRSCLADRYYFTTCFDETARQRDETICRSTRRPRSVDELVFSGPHFYIATPFNKSPNDSCKTKSDYAPLDATQISDTFTPSTNYIPGCKRPEFESRIPEWSGRRITDFFRHAHREMVSPTGERTFVACIIPPGVTHIHTVYSASFVDESKMVVFSGLASSIVVDFLVKTTGASHLGKSLAEQLPCDAGLCTTAVVQRTLQLNCLTTHYADLYDRNLPKRKDVIPSANPDPRCAGWDKLPRKWARDAALRTPYARRQALVELDALAALSLGLTLDQLLLLYRVQFPVLQQYERETWYDQRGKIVFTVNRGLSGVGLERKQFEPIADAKAGAKLPDYAFDQQGPFVPPFDTCSREADMARAYEFFRERLGITIDSTE